MKWNKSKEEIRANDVWQIQKTNAEMVLGFDKMSNLPPCISIFGSARLPDDNKYCVLAEEIAFRFSEKGFGVITGGGPSIMKNANMGCVRGKSASVGIGIRLPFETKNNDYIDNDKNLIFDYFHTRKVMLVKYSQCFVVLPGSVGTLDEAFEVINMQLCYKVEKYPIYLVGSEYWKGLIDWLKNSVIAEGCMSEKDLDLFRIVDTADEIIESFDKFFDKYRKENKLNF